MEDPWASFNSAAVIQSVSSSWTLVTFAVNTTHASRRPCVAHKGRKNVESYEITSEVVEFQFLRSL